MNTSPITAHELELELDVANHSGHLQELLPRIQATANDDPALGEVLMAAWATRATELANFPDPAQHADVNESSFEDDPDFGLNEAHAGAVDAEVPTESGAAAPAGAVKAKVSAGSGAVAALYDIGERIPFKSFPHQKTRPIKEKGVVVDVEVVGIESTYENAQHLLASYGITARYNLMSRSTEVVVPSLSFSRDNGENASLAVIRSLFRLHGLRAEDALPYIDLLAERSAYHPVREWVLSKPWDGTSRIRALLDTVGTGIEHIELKDALIRRWLISAVAAAFSENPRDKFEGVLVFSGAQGIGKTTWFRKLVPSELCATLEGASLDPANKDSVLNVTSHWLVELGELGSTFRKADVDRLKAFISDTEDKLRQAYAARRSNFKRRTVLFGSVNENAFLTDSTGNRRWWSLPVTSINYNHGIDMQQLWAEVHQLYVAGEQWHLTEREAASLNVSNKAHEAINPVEEALAESFVFDEQDEREGFEPCTRGTMKLTATAVAKGLGLDWGSKKVTNEVGAAIRKLSGKESKRDFKHGRHWELVPRSHARGMFEKLF